MSAETSRQGVLGFSGAGRDNHLVLAIALVQFALTQVGDYQPVQERGCRQHV